MKKTENGCGTIGTSRRGIKSSEHRAKSNRRSPQRRVEHARIPLRYRLPNAPPLFVGRAAETTALKNAIKRAPVTLVWGLGGIGKTALVLHTLHKSFATSVPRTVMLSVPKRTPAIDLAREVLGTVSHACGVKQTAATDSRNRQEAIVETVVDLVESRNLFVVIDNVHHAAPHGQSAFFAALSQYLRKARFIATSRSNPDLPGLADQVLPLAGMRAADLERLARACASKLSRHEIRRTVDLAGGSPWRLRQALQGGVTTGDDESHEPCHDLSKSEIDILHALFVVEIPIDVQAISNSIAERADRALRRLEQGGFVERTAGGFRLHDVSRPLVEDQMSRPLVEEWTERMARTLSLAGEPNQLLESARLYFALGQDNVAISVLEKNAEILVGGVSAQELWSLIATVDDTRLARLRLMCAVELGDAEILGKIPEPSADALDDCLLWATAHHRVGGPIETTSRVALKVLAAAQARDRPDVAFEAGLLVARTHILIGGYDTALALLESLNPMDPYGAARRDLSKATFLVYLAKKDEAVKIVREIRSRLPGLAPKTRVEIEDFMLGFFLTTADIGTAVDFVTREIAPRMRKRPANYLERQVVFRSAAVLVWGGRLKEAKGLLDRAEPHFVSTQSHRIEYGLAEIPRRIMVGEFTDIDSAIERLVDDSTSYGSHDLASYAQSWRVDVASLRGESPEPPSAPKSGTPLPMVGARWLAIANAQHRVRHGLGIEAPPDGWFSKITADEQLNYRIAEAAFSFGRGLYSEAAQVLDETVGTARRDGHAVIEASARAALCDALVALENWEGLRHASSALDRLARSFPSPRFENEALFFAMASGETPLDPVLLERMALLFDVAPVAARRARILLGGRASSDAIDKVVLAAIHRRARGAHVETLVRDSDSRDWKHGWGLDEIRCAVWLPSEQTISFSKRPVAWKILCAIADTGGVATKETIVLRTSPTNSYHPLRDDNRLHAAVKNIRALIEGDVRNPELLQTTADGYAFGRVHPFRRLFAEPQATRAE